MVLITDISPDDSKDVILLKAARQLGEIPSSTLIIDEAPGRVNAISLGEKIKELAKKRGSTMASIRKQILDDYPQISPEAVNYEYIIIQKNKFKSLPDGEALLKLTLEGQKIPVGEIFSLMGSGLDFYISRKEREAATLETELKRKTVKAVELESVVGVPFTTFQVELTTYFINAVYDDYSDFPSDLYALDLFASTATSSQVVYIELNYEGKKYYKVHTPIVDLKKVVAAEEYPMVVVVKDGQDFINIYFEFNTASNQFKIIFNALQKKSQDLVLDALFQSMPRITKSPQQELNVRGNFMMQGLNVNYFVLADIILNNPLFSKHVYMDESSSVLSQKTRLNIHYKLPRDQKILFMTHNEGDDINIRISKAPNKKEVAKLATVLGKLLTLYQQLEPTVIAEYGVYGMDLTDRKNVKKRDIIIREKSNVKNLSTLVPDLFVKQYARKCQKEKQPSIIDAEEIAEFEGRGMDVMEFPQEEDANKQYYICDHKDYPYPGLQVNTLVNKNEYPYIPCCFTENQLKSNRSKYYEYVMEQDPANREKKDISHTITLLKVLDTPGRKANLPKNVSDWISNYIGGSEKEEYFRQGVIQGPLNFIHAVLSAIDDDYNSLTSVTDQKEYVEKYLVALNNTINLEACKQSNYELTMQQITEWWLDPERYHDVLRFVRLVEVYHNIKILVISPERMLVPRFIEFYARTPIDIDRHKVVLLFNHYGSAGIDGLTDAHNELVVDRFGKGVFSGVEARKLYEVYERAATFYKIPIGLKEIVKVDQPLIFIAPTLLTPKLQYIDGYGRVRLIVFNYQGITAAMQIPPSMPYNLKSISLDALSDYVVDSMSPRQAQGLIQKLGGNIIGSSGGQVDGIWFTVGFGATQGKYFIPTSEPNADLLVLDALTLWDLIPRNNRLEQLRFARRRANILLSIFLYYLRLFKKQLPLSTGDARKFIDAHTVVRDGHQYDIPFYRILPIVDGNTQRALGQLTERYPGYIESGKIIIDSKDLQERLHSVLLSDVGVFVQTSRDNTLYKLAEYVADVHKMNRPLTDAQIDTFMEQHIVFIFNHIYADTTIESLPESSRENLVEIADKLPSYFDGKKLILDTPAQRVKLKHFLQSTIPIGNTYVIDNYYAYNYNFNGRDDEQTFIGEEQFTNWIKIYGAGDNLYISKSTQPANEFPYVMEFPDPVGLGWVQNTALGTREAALSVAYGWIERGVNTGYATAPSETDDEATLRYNITEYFIHDGEWRENKIILDPSQPTLSILVVPQNKYYSAILNFLGNNFLRKS